jgi:hypothetical protein
VKWRERSFESILDKILADGSPPLKANRVAEFAVSEPYKEPVRYLRSFRGKLRPWRLQVANSSLGGRFKVAPDQAADLLEVLVKAKQLRPKLTGLGGNPNVVAGYRRAFSSKLAPYSTVEIGAVTAQWRSLDKALLEKAIPDLEVLFKLVSGSKPTEHLALDDGRDDNAFRLREGFDNLRVGFEKG